VLGSSAESMQHRRRPWQHPQQRTRSPVRDRYGRPYEQARWHPTQATDAQPSWPPSARLTKHRLNVDPLRPFSHVKTADFHPSPDSQLGHHCVPGHIDATTAFNDYLDRWAPGCLVAAGPVPRDISNWTQPTARRAGQGAAAPALIYRRSRGRSSGHAGARLYSRVAPVL
jgi:hypothetical protein